MDKHERQKAHDLYMRENDGVSPESLARLAANPGWCFVPNPRFEAWQKLHNWEPEPPRPIYRNAIRERQRLAWIKWRDRLYRLLKTAGMEGGCVRRTNMLMEMVWPFPVDAPHG